MSKLPPDLGPLGQMWMVDLSVLTVGFVLVFSFLFSSHFFPRRW
jgi:hypothetical protein